MTNKPLTLEQELKAYAQEIGAEYFPLSALINSHRLLHAIQRKDEKERQVQLREVLFRYETTLKQQEMITLQKLSEMSINQVAVLLTLYNKRQQENYNEY